MREGNRPSNGRPGDSGGGGDDSNGTAEKSPPRAEFAMSILRTGSQIYIYIYIDFFFDFFYHLLRFPIGGGSEDPEEFALFCFLFIFGVGGKGRQEQMVICTSE